MKPRYVVGSVTGWPITERSLNAERHRPSPTPTTGYYVLDSAYCFKVVASFDRGFNQHTKPKERAEALCKKLNAEEEQWRASLQSPNTTE